MTITFLVFVILVTLTHGHYGSMTAIGHYFACTVSHFPLYSPYDDDYRTSITAVYIFIQLHSVCYILHRGL